jgi:predicted O-methyltransferase YrrM
MSLRSEILRGMRSPRKVMLYLLLGHEKFFLLSETVNRDTCYSWKANQNNPLEIHMTKPTDIHEHLATLFMLTIEFNLKRIVELGTREGESTVALLQAAKQINGKVFSIDIDPCLRAKRLIQKYELQKYWEFTQADDLKMKWSTPIDHLFIDTSHTFDQTLRELEKYEPYVRHGGIITMHDIVSSQGVLSAITKYLENRDDLAFYKYFNNNGLGVIFKR